MRDCIEKETRKGEMGKICLPKSKGIYCHSGHRKQQVPVPETAIQPLQNYSCLGNQTQNRTMKNIHKNRTPQQILDYYPHPIAQPDTEEARQTRVAQRFRVHFLAPVERKLAGFGKKVVKPARQERARALLVDAEGMKALMYEPHNAFLLKDHASHVETVLTGLRALIASFTP